MRLNFYSFQHVLHLSASKNEIPPRRRASLVLSFRQLRRYYLNGQKRERIGQAAFPEIVKIGRKVVSKKILVIPILKTGLKIVIYGFPNFCFGN